MQDARRVGNQVLLVRSCAGSQMEALVQKMVLRLVPAILALTAACGPTGPQMTDVQLLDPQTHVKALVVLPVALAMQDSTALDIAMRTDDVVRWVMKKGSQPIVGPADFSLLHPVDEISVVSADTDLMTRASDLKLPVREAAVLHILVTENRATNVRDIQDVRNSDPKKQPTFRQHGLEAHLRTEVWLSDALRGRRLAGLVVETTDDPTEVMPGGDPRPGLTLAIQLALDKLLEIAGPLLSENGVRQTTGEGLVDCLPATLAWAPPGKQSWEELNKGKADVVREAAALALWDRVAPNLSAKELLVASRNRGVLVRKAQGDLLPGDLIVSIYSHPLTTAYQLDRVLQVAGREGVRAQLLRAGAPVDVQLHGPLVPAVTP
jgi:hypothetical protein